MYCMYVYVRILCVLCTQHLERLEAVCSQFHSTHWEMGDDVKSVSELQDHYRKFLDIIAVSVV